MRSRASLSASSACGSQDFAAASISSALTRMPTLARSSRSNFSVSCNKRAVAVSFHLGEDMAHGGFDVLRRLAFDGEEVAETRGEIGVFAVQSKRHRQVNG